MLNSTSIVDGRDDGGVMGEMKGEMEMTRSLYLKELESSDGRDGHKFNNARLFFNNGRLFNDNEALLALVFLL